MKAVSQFEANLLHLLHGFLRRVPRQQVRLLAQESLPRPDCLSRAAVELVKEALAKGCVQILAEQGGWRRERHLRRERAVEGRLWERTPPSELGLQFSRRTMEFLIWITSVRLEEARTTVAVAPEELTPADCLLFYLAYDALLLPERAARLGAHPVFFRGVLCRLAFAGNFARSPQDDVPDFLPWTAGPGACILEALQPELANRLIQGERRKGQLKDGQTMRAVGEDQVRVLEAFLQAVDQAQRPDLARFLLLAAADLLPEGVTAEAWVGSLTSAGARLADRAETYRAALAFPRLLLRLRQWAQRAGGVGFLDEGYAASQLWKADWERLEGDGLCRRAEAVIRQVDPMRQT
jgi:hypothetical protein